MKKSVRVEVETLDCRINPSVAVVGSNVVVTGTPANDVLRVQTLTGNLLRVTDNGVVTNVALPVGGHVIVNALEGHDNITILGLVPSELHGGDGNDTITGGSGVDVIWGDAGSDLMAGGAGHDVLQGGSGQDRLSGDSGNDLLVGGEAVGYAYGALLSVGNAWATGSVTDPLFVSSVVDTETDRLTGGTTADWFVANSFDTLTDYVSPPDAWDVV